MTYGGVEYAGGGYGAPEAASATAGTFPAVAVEIAFTTAPASTAPAWVDVTTDVREIAIRRGRQKELDRYQAGHCTVTLDNSLRLYDPEYSGGYGSYSGGYSGDSYSPNIKPMRRMRVRATYAGVTYPLFDGYVDSWDQSYTIPNDAVATVDASDAFKVLANSDLPVSVYALEVAADTPSWWLRLDEPTASTVAYNIGSVGGTAAYQGGVTLGAADPIVNDASTAATFDGVDDCVSLGSTAVITALPYTIEMWLKLSSRSAILGQFYFYCQGRDGNTGSVGQPSGHVRGNDLGNPGILYFDTVSSTSRVDDDAWHHVVITADATSVLTLYIDGVAQATGTATTPSGAVPPEGLLAYPAVAGFTALTRKFWPGSIDEFAIYNTALSATRVAAHTSAGLTPWSGDLTGARITRILDQAGWSSTARSIDTGNSTLQSASLATSVLEHAQKVQQSEFGDLFITADGRVRFVSRDQLINAPVLATFGDSTAELPCADIDFDYSDQLIRNSVTVSRNAGLAQTVEDATSVAAYLRQSYSIDGLIHNDDGLSKDAATFLVSEYKDPLLRPISLTVSPRRAPSTLFPVVLAAELGSKLTVKRRPQAVGSAISQDSVIQGEQHRITPDSWRVDWSLSPAYAGEFLELDATTGSGLDTARLYF